MKVLSLVIPPYIFPNTVFIDGYCSKWLGHGFISNVNVLISSYPYGGGRAF